MKTCTLHIVGTSTYSSSRAHQTPLLDRERPDAYDARTWPEKLHFKPSTGEVFIPGIAFKFALDSAASFLSEKVPGKGQKTYTKIFKSGITVPEHLWLKGPKGEPILKPDVKSVSIHAHANGQRNSGKRVYRQFPVVPEWQGALEVAILDDAITPEVFERHLEVCSQYIGVGRFRPENAGINGRFSFEIEWTTPTKTATSRKSSK